MNYIFLSFFIRVPWISASTTMKLESWQRVPLTRTKVQNYSNNTTLTTGRPGALCQTIISGFVCSRWSIFLTPLSPLHFFFSYVFVLSAVCLAFSCPSSISDLSLGVLVCGSKNRNRAVHGDVVVVELLPKSEWRGKVTALTESQGEERSGEENESKPMPTGGTIHNDLTH